MGICSASCSWEVETKQENYCIRALELQRSGSPSVSPRPATSSPSDNLWEMQLLRPHPRPTEWETGEGTSPVVLTDTPGHPDAHWSLRITALLNMANQHVSDFLCSLLRIIMKWLKKLGCYSHLNFLMWEIINIKHHRKNLGGDRCCLNLNCSHLTFLEVLDSVCVCDILKWRKMASLIRKANEEWMGLCRREEQ